MKKLTFVIALLIVGLQSCKDNNVKEQHVKSTQTVIKTDCYQAIYKKDTLNLELNTIENGTISGALIMKVFGEPHKVGKIEGKFSGDTLFADYTFSLATAEKTIYKNPMALLKKDSLLILGNGQIQTTMGRSYIVKDVPIDFERVKYKFSNLDCKTK